MEGIKGENAPNYKKVVGKSQVHRWMDKHYGRPQVCEMENCSRKCIWFDWALKTGKKYERDKDNFLRLCRSCHRRYDLTPEKRRQAMKNLVSFKKGHKLASKLTKKDANKIRELVLQGIERSVVARRYKITESNVYYIVNNLTWKNQP